MRQRFNIMVSLWPRFSRAGEPQLSHLSNGSDKVVVMIKYNNAFRWLTYTMHLRLKGFTLLVVSAFVITACLLHARSSLNSLLGSSLYIDMCSWSTIPGFRLEQLSPMCKCLSLSQGIYSQLKVTSTDFWDLLLPATTWLHCEERWCHAMHRQGAAPFLSYRTLQVVPPGSHRSSLGWSQKQGAHGPWNEFLQQSGKGPRVFKK